MEKLFILEPEDIVCLYVFEYRHEMYLFLFLFLFTSLCFSLPKRYNIQKDSE